MKKKEIKNLAKKIAQQELIIQTSEITEEKNNARDKIIKLSSYIKSFEDMMLLDEAIQDLLTKNS